VNIVVDTNVALSGLLWGGPPNQLLKWARDRKIRILACSKAVDELQRVLGYSKFATRIETLEISPQDAMSYFLGLISLVPDPERVPSIIKEDPFDNLFLAMASLHQAKLIVSGDRHLLELGSFESIQIVTPAEGVQVITRIEEAAGSLA